jgi:hypothetical protein
MSCISMQYKKIKHVMRIIKHSLYKIKITQKATYPTNENKNWNILITESAI